MVRHCEEFRMETMSSPSAAAEQYGLDFKIKVAQSSQWSQK